jgi:hypothetical protein
MHNIVNRHFFAYALIPATAILIFIIFGIESQNLPSIFGQVQSNFTSTVCNADGTCMTTICINNEPCKIIKSNSTMGTGQNSSNDDQNETSPLAKLPQQII